MSLRSFTQYKSITGHLTRAILNQSVSHAYIFEGDSCTDKTAFAREFVKALLCREEPGDGCDNCVTCRKIEHDNYEDLYHIKSDGISLKDEAVSSLQSKLINKPVAGERNVAIIENADSMTVRAQNRLLKTLEEPANGTVIVLLSENTQNLLPTINSRCITYRLWNYDLPDLDIQLKDVSDILNMLYNHAYFCDIKNSLDKIIKEKNDALHFLDCLERLYRKELCNDIAAAVTKSEIIKNVQYVEAARRDLQRNANYKYTIRNLILKIGG